MANIKTGKLDKKTGEPLRKKQRVEVRFIDSIKFMNGSLDSHVENLKTGCVVKDSGKLEEYEVVTDWDGKDVEDNSDDPVDTRVLDVKKVKEIFKFTSEFVIEKYGEDALVKFLRKGVYPYEYMDSFKKLEETEFPRHEDFYSNLLCRNVKKKDYEYAKKLYYDYGFKNLKEYHDFYLEMDTLLLADVWENFRETIKRTHKLDVSHYYTVSGYSWDALLMMSGQELGLFSDPDMLFMVERCVRGGIAQASHRHAVANNQRYEKRGRWNIAKQPIEH